MRITANGVQVDTMEYAEGPEVAFACFAVGDELCQDLATALAGKDGSLDLWRGDEHIAVHVRDYEVWPPVSGRLGGAIHRHTVRLERAGDADNARPLPIMAQSMIESSIAIAGAYAPAAR